jgi:hypothetical protein
MIFSKSTISSDMSSLNISFNVCRISDDNLFVRTILTSDARELIIEPVDLAITKLSTILCFLTSSTSPILPPVIRLILGESTGVSLMRSLLDWTFRNGITGAG